MEYRKAKRVVFERGFAANMMAIDGTWRRPCTMEDVSETGARLTVDGSIEGLPLKEFFLLLSTMGNAYRRCQLAWVNGDQVGVFSSNRATRRKNPKAAVRHFRQPPDEVCSRIGKLWLVVATFRVWNLILPETADISGGKCQQANPKVSIRT